MQVNVSLVDWDGNYLAGHICAANAKKGLYAKSHSVETISIYMYIYHLSVSYF